MVQCGFRGLLQGNLGSRAFDVRRHINPALVARTYCVWGSVLMTAAGARVFGDERGELWTRLFDLLLNPTLAARTEAAGERRARGAARGDGGVAPGELQSREQQPEGFVEEGRPGRTGRQGRAVSPYATIDFVSSSPARRLTRARAWSLATSTSVRSHHDVDIVLLTMIHTSFPFQIPPTSTYPL
ncbi:hypothetical protein NUW54_g10550 [Trametes sanguinea]|uniref:Uncharacterized protein n=1 Tax=Trametes sanguinea TaxID=158606 RepID=A0ACC1NY67_9APHY|nr:hypothetical protein NUW54_g10550 [Trametes sanguinea]